MQLVTSIDGCVVEDLNSTNGVFLNGKRVRKHKLVPGDVIKVGLHELAYSRADLPSEPDEDPRATRTTVLQDSDYETDEDDPEAEDEERDESSYSSIERGS